MTINVNLTGQQVIYITSALHEAARNWRAADPTGSHAVADTYRNIAQQLLAANADEDRNPHIPVIITA